jgi:error-prone DNA polymerase
LKHYYPAAFAAALINSQPMGFYAPAQLIRDARQHGVQIQPVDVNHSDWDCTLEGRHTLRLGFRLIRGLSQKDAETIERARHDGPFASVDELARRTGLLQGAISRLAAADAFGSLDCDRRQGIWNALALPRNRRPAPLLDDLDEPNESPGGIQPASVREEVIADYQTTGLSLRPHPVSFYREALDRLGVLSAERLSRVPNNRQVKVAGIIIMRQRPSTGKGITFVTLEDETGVANLVLHKNIWERFHRIARHSNAWLVRGRLESRHRVIHVIVQHLQDLQEQLTDVIQSRDFR